MNKKNKIIISITGIVLVLLILVGLTYGYYLTRISGNTNDKSISIDMADLELTYSDGNGLIEAKSIIPGETIATKTFTVKNTGNAKVSNYVVYLDSVVNTFEDKNDLKLTLTCTSDIGNCNGTNITYPSTNTMLITNDIEKDELQSYELKVEFIETNDDQSDNMNKEMSGNIVIKDLKSLNNEIENINGTDTAIIEEAKMLSNYRIYGNSIQEGTPTPDNPVEIESVGDLVTDTNDTNYGKYKIPIKVTGKNLFDQSLFNTDVGTNAIYITYEIPNGTYTMSTNYSNYTYANVFVFSGTITSGISSPDNGVTINTPRTIIVSDGHFTVAYRSANAQGDINPKNFNWQLEEGNTATTYEPYQEPITYNIYLNEPLRKIGDYTDYIDFKSGKVVRNIKEKIFNGTESWDIGNSGTNIVNQRFFLFDSDIIANGSLLSNILEEKYPGRTSIFSNDVEGCNISNGKMYQIKINKTYFTNLNYDVSVAGFKKYLSDLNNENKPVKVCTLLNSKKEEAISLPVIYLSDEKNYLYVETSISSSKMELEVIK